MRAPLGAGRTCVVCSFSSSSPAVGEAGRGSGATLAGSTCAAAPPLSPPSPSAKVGEDECCSRVTCRSLRRSVISCCSRVSVSCRVSRASAWTRMQRRQ